MGQMAVAHFALAHSVHIHSVHIHSVHIHSVHNRFEHIRWKSADIGFPQSSAPQNIVMGLFLPIFLSRSFLNRSFLNWRLFRLIVRSLTLSIALNGSVVFKLIHFIDHSFLEFTL